MARIAPRPPIETDGPVIEANIVPAHLSEPVTETEALFVLAHVAVPRVGANDWSLDIAAA